MSLGKGLAPPGRDRTKSLALISCGKSEISKSSHYSP